MERDRNTTPGPDRTATRRIIAGVLVVALALTAPLGLLASPGGARLLGVLLIVAMLIGGVVYWLHRRTR